MFWQLPLHHSQLFRWSQAVPILLSRVKNSKYPLTSAPWADSASTVESRPSRNTLTLTVSTRTLILWTLAPFACAISTIGLCPLLEPFKEGQFRHWLAFRHQHLLLWRSTAQPHDHDQSELWQWCLPILDDSNGWHNGANYYTPNSCQEVFIVQLLLTHDRPRAFPGRKFSTAARLQTSSLWWVSFFLRLKNVALHSDSTEPFLHYGVWYADSH